MMNAEQLCKRYETLQVDDQQGWSKLRQDYYTYCAPHRDPRLDATGVMVTGQGPRPATEVWDATAPVACMRGAGKIQRAMTPDQEDWIDLGPGPLVPEKERDRWKRELKDTTAILRGVLDAGPFGLAAGEWYQDIYAGQGVLLVLKGDTKEDLVKFCALPPEQVQTEDDAQGRTFRWMYLAEFSGEDIQRDWPNGKLHQDMARLIADDPCKKHLVLQTCEKLGPQKFRYCVVDKKNKHEIHVETMRTSPFISPRFFKAAGMRRGVGPPMLAMPTIKTANKSVEFILKAAAFAILGAWMTTDDGVYNPRTSVLAPGGMIKVSRTGGPIGASLARLPIPDNFNLSDIVLKDLRIMIREMLHDDDLPYEGGAVRSPTEIVERLKRLVQHIAGAFGRLFAEGVIPLVQRVLDIADQFSLLPSYFQIDNLLVKAQVISPLANAQMLEDVEKAVRLVELIASLFGPQEAQVQVDPDKFGPYLQEKLGAPVSLLRDPASREKVREELRQAAIEAYQAEAMKQARADVGKIKKAA